MRDSARPIIVIEDDPFIRIVQVVLDPTTPEERVKAFAFFFEHDLPDFAGWRQAVRDKAGCLYPAEVRTAANEAGFRELLPGAVVAIVEFFSIGAKELALAGTLRVVQQYGTITRDIDAEACAKHGARVLTLRRRANIACAEQTLAFMLTFAKKLDRVTGLISVEQLAEAGYRPATFDRRHTANSGWARIPGLKMLYESTLGIVGFGEIGRELALRAAAFGMRVLYYQRTRLTPEEEARYGATYAPLEALLGQSDWVSVQLPLTDSTRGLIDERLFALMKPGAFLINTARAEIIDRDALIEALRSGRLGGFALDPQYEEPGRSDDELLFFDNVILTPHTAAQPRFNALNDIEEMIVGIARALQLA
jgi:phosphoglycerate dehydrogenase-like enzyme